MHHLLAMLFTKRRNTEKQHLEERIDILERQVNTLSCVIGSLILGLYGSTRKASFAMVIENCFNISGRGVVVVGRIEKGSVKLGDKVLVESPRWSVQTTILGIEKHQETLTQAWAGDNVGLFISDINIDQATEAVLLRSSDSGVDA